MKKRSQARLKENQYVKELLAVLKENPSPSSKEFMEMVSHVSELENRLADAVEELKVMRQELQRVQSRTLKAVLQRGCKTMESNISSMRQHLTELKAHIVKGCQNALTAIKEQGISALDGIGRFFHIEPMLNKIGKIADRSVQADTKAIEKIHSLSSEYHEAGRHLKNIGRTFLGKEVLNDAKSPGKFAAVLTAPYKANKSCMLAVKQNVEKALENLSQLHERVQQRTSVLKAIKENSDKVQPPVKKELAAPCADKSEL